MDLIATKELSGRALKANEFTFVLKDWSGKELERVGNREDGSIPLTPRRFGRAGTFLYTLAEVAGSEPDIAYDTTIHTIRVTVSDADGTLKARQSYLKSGVPESNPPHFVNTYEMPRTGDNRLRLIITLFSLSAIATGTAILVRRKRKEI